METRINQNTSVSLGDVSSQAETVNANYLMLQVQMTLAEDFDNQVREAAKQIKFLGGIKKQLREQVATVQEFMGKSPNTSRKDGKHYIEADASELAKLFGAFKKPEYKLDGKLEEANYDLKWDSMGVADTGDKHELDTAKNAAGNVFAPVNNGEILAGDLSAYFQRVSEAKGDAAFDLAKKSGSDDTSLPFYFGNKNNKTDAGAPKFAVYTEAIDKMLERLKGVLTDVESDTEELSAKLTVLTNQRKAALEGAQQLRQKMDDIRSNTTSKLDR